ncbi:MAG: diaminopimelate epimerase [Deltaproteobacteria bacterium]|jgi:diaminopimelate epimerase|nr:diaminopimelate epimerase [Deltaproteobacteria bacterium]
MVHQTMEKFSFHKYSGHGNDFVIIDNWNGPILDADQSRVSKLLSRPKFGVGADGVVFIGAGPDEVDFAVRFFNSDGSEAEMCGNAIRCAAHLAHFLNIAPANMTFKTKAGVVESTVKERQVTVLLPKISRPEGAALVEVEGFSQTYFRINTGVSHAVAFVDDLESINVAKYGRAVRFHNSFSPEGANVDFVRVVGDNVLDVRTYERGVEAETLACGTGATAASLLAVNQGLVKGDEIICHTRGGEDLTVSFEGKPDAPTKVFLKGEVRYVFSGQVGPDIFKK